MRHCFFSGLLVLLCAAPAWADVKNVDSRFIEIEAIEGRAPTVEGALMAACQASIEQVLKGTLLDTPAALQKYVEVRATLLGEAGAYTSGVKMTDKYRDGDTIVVVVSGPVEIGKLRQRLLSLGVIQDVTQGVTAAQLPRLALRAAEGRSDYPTAVALSTIHHRLAERRLAILDEGRQRDLAREDQEMLGLQGSGPRMSAADVELAVRAKVVPTQAFGELQMYQAEVFIEAYIPGLPTPFAREVYTSREMSFKSAADHKKSQAACVEEAIGGALSPLMARLLRELQDEKDHGKTGALRVVATGADLDHIEKALRDRFENLAAAAGTGHRLFVARWADQLDDVLELIANDPELELTAEPLRGPRHAVVHVRKRVKRRGAS